MKRFHVHVSVKDLQQSIRFYSSVFGVPPTLEKPDYAKWMIEDPRLNFAISQRGGAPGVNHLGLQVESDEELEDLRARAAKARLAVLDEPGASCCYAKSDKYWVQDPQGVAWETYHTLGEVPTFSGAEGSGEAASGCCTGAGEPRKVEASCCGGPPARRADACCAKDEAAKDAGEAGCGCAAPANACCA